MTREEAYRLAMRACEETWNEKTCKQIKEVLEQTTWIPCPDNDGERELLDRAVKALETEFATKTCNKQIASKLENAELARDSRETCNNKQVSCKLVASKDAISRQAAIDAIGKDPMGGLNYEGILTRLPSITPKQRTGHWQDTAGLYFCSECDCGYARAYRFCPNCGARMVEPQESDGQALVDDPVGD